MLNWLWKTSSLMLINISTLLCLSMVGKNKGQSIQGLKQYFKQSSFLFRRANLSSTIIRLICYRPAHEKTASLVQWLNHQARNWKNVSCSLEESLVLSVGLSQRALKTPPPPFNHELQIFSFISYSLYRHKTSWVTCLDSLW